MNFNPIFYWTPVTEPSSNLELNTVHDCPSVCFSNNPIEQCGQSAKDFTFISALGEVKRRRKI